MFNDNTIKMNPFVYNSPVRGKDFFNREQAVEKILKETVRGKSQGSIWITGERQIGKTSLLRHVQSMNDEFNEKVTPYGTKKSLDVAFVFANVQGCENEDEFYNTLWQGLKDFFDFKLKKGANGYKNFINAMTEVYIRRKYFTVFLIDEFDAFIETISYKEIHTATNFLAKLSSLLQEIDEIDEGSKTFSCVFTANHDIKELLTANGIDNRGSGLIVEALNLKWFTQTQVSELVKKYMKDSDFQFTESEIELCFKSAQGYPYFTQKMLSLMYDAKKIITNDKQYRNTVKVEFGEMFKETIEDWGGDNMPMRTLKKLIEMVQKMDLGRQFTVVVMKTLEIYLRAKMGP
jgi:Cdc6-like AAA superfamily ATPase